MQIADSCQNAHAMVNMMGAGMHFGLQQASPSATVVAAYDLNEVANDVYEHNFGWRPWQVQNDLHCN